MVKGSRFETSEGNEKEENGMKAPVGCEMSRRNGGEAASHNVTQGVGRWLSLQRCQVSRSAEH